MLSPPNIVPGPSTLPAAGLIRRWIGCGAFLVLAGTSALRLQAQSISVTPSAPNYQTAGGTVTFTVTVAIPAGASSVAFEIGHVPAGWTFGGAAGANRPDLVPAGGTTDRFEFAYLSVPASPATFTFTANYAAGLFGAQTFDAIAGIVRPFAVSVPTAEIVLSPAAGIPGPPSPGVPTLAKLVNVSARSQTGTGTSTLIAGFVVAGSSPIQVLVRGVGPTLTQYGVGGALPAAHIDLFAGSATTPLSSADDWGVGSNAEAIANATAQVGAFPLPAGSHDAALLSTLAPGAYTAVVTGQAGASGVALVEIYDAGGDSNVSGPRIVDLSARATAGSADGTLTAGFVISGGAPTKRVLIRAVGPALAAFGIMDALARPQLTVLDQNNTTLAFNAGWSTAGDPAALAQAAAAAGAFAFSAGTQDSAVLLDLPPGLYTAQVSGSGGTRGVALVEVYEVP